MMEINSWEINNLKLETSDFETVNLDQISYNGVLAICLSSNNQHIKIIFDRFVSYRVSDESVLLEYWQNGETKTEESGIIFFKLKNSSFLGEMARLSFDFAVLNKLNSVEHYAIFLMDDCIEILSAYPPNIMITEKYNN